MQPGVALYSATLGWFLDGMNRMDRLHATTTHLTSALKQRNGLEAR